MQLINAATFQNQENFSQPFSEKYKAFVKLPIQSTKTFHVSKGIFSEDRM